MKNLKARSGITLIALVITIIVLIILAGVAINLTLGQNGLLNRTKEAREKYEIASAKEYIELKIDECIIEKGGDASLQDIIDYLAEDSSVTYYVALEEVGLVAGEVEIGSPKEIYVVYNSYQFKVNESKNVEFISIVDVDLEGKVSIEAQVKEHLGKNADEKYEARVLLKATGDAEISKLEIQNPDGTRLTLEPDGLTTVGKDMTIEFDKTYKVILTTANGHKYTKKIIEKSEETIMNAEQLASFRDRVNSGLTYEGKIVKLGADIDLSTVCGANVGGKEVSWEPIGTETTSFKGTFDGTFYKIEKLYINTNENYQGVFRCSEGVIEDLVVSEDSQILASSYSAAVIGKNDGIVRQCINNALVTATGNGSAGIVGYNSGIVEKCINNGHIINNKYNCAGICAYNKSGTIQNCYNTGKIEGNMQVGGIIGNNADNTNILSKVYNCYSIGGVSGGSYAVGGIIGRAVSKSYSDIKNNYWLLGTGATYGIGDMNSNVQANGVNSNILQGYATTLGEAFTNDIKEKVVDESTGAEKEVWKYNNGYPILKWQLQENQVAE